MHNSIKQKGRGSTGFTLVEVLVAFAIFIVMLGVIYAMFYSGLDVWGAARVQADLQAKARIALGFMVSELRNTTRTSTQVPSPNLSIPPLPNNNGITFCLPRDLDGDGLITDANGNTEWDTGNPIQYQYIPVQNEIRRLDNAGAITFARDVADVRFIDINIDPTLSIDELRIVLTLSKITEKQRNILIRLSSIVGLRN